jgi:hypothetical protein
MADVTFEDILDSVGKLTPQQRLILTEVLRGMDDDIASIEHEPTRQEIIAELDALRANGAFNNQESLRNKYANPTLNQLTEEQILKDIHDAATEWEKEIDEFFGKDTD